jgi:hypothetical protein
MGCLGYTLVYLFHHFPVVFKCTLVSRWFGALWCTRVCRPWEVGVFLWDTQVFRCAVVYRLTGAEMVDQRLSAEAKILGDLGICSGLQTVRRGLANKGHFRLTFRANRPAYEPTLTANEPTLGSWPVLVTSKVNRGCSPLPCA